MLSLVRVAATALVVQAGLASTGGASCEEREARQSQAEPTRTGKERLGGKASDEQRVDNCKVPLDLRGSTPRPDECRDNMTAGSQR